MLATLHNVHYFQELMRGARGAIEKGRFESFRKEISERHAANDSAQ